MLTVLKGDAAVVLELVQLAVIRVTTDIPVTEPAMVVWRSVKDTRGRVRERVGSEHLEHIVIKHAVLPVNKDVKKKPVSVVAVLTRGMETSVMAPVMVVLRDATERRGSVRGRVLSINLVHVVSTGAVLHVNKDAIRNLVSVLNVLKRDMDTCVTRLVVLAVNHTVTDTMGAVHVKLAGKARNVAVIMLLSLFQPLI